MSARQREKKDSMSTIIDTIEKEQQKSDVTNFKVGDGVRVHTRVREGDKERIQIFGGIVIGRKVAASTRRSPSAASPTAKASSACSRFTRLASRRSRSRKPAKPAARS
jgi:hypothetical protein